MTDTSEREAVEQFLRRADRVYDEYDEGYVDADAALATLERHVEDLRAATTEEEK
jgi:hypothetical protein